MCVYSFISSTNMAEITTHLFLFQSGSKKTFQRCEPSGVRRPSCLAFSVHRDPFTKTGRAFFFFFFFISRLSSFQSMMHKNESHLTTQGDEAWWAAFSPGGEKSEICFI